MPKHGASLVLQHSDMFNKSTPGKARERVVGLSSRPTSAVSSMMLGSNRSASRTKMYQKPCTSPPPPREDDGLDEKEAMALGIPRRHRTVLEIRRTKPSTCLRPVSTTLQHRPVLEEKGEDLIWKEYKTEGERDRERLMYEFLVEEGCGFNNLIERVGEETRYVSVPGQQLMFRRIPFAIFEKYRLSLEDALDDTPSFYLLKTWTRNIAYQLAELHAAGLVHNMITPKTIVLTHNCGFHPLPRGSFTLQEQHMAMIAKLSDLSCATIGNSAKLSAMSAFTVTGQRATPTASPLYALPELPDDVKQFGVAPEVVKKNHSSPASDMYQLGKLIQYCLLGNSGDITQQLEASVASGNVKATLSPRRGSAARKCAPQLSMDGATQVSKAIARMSGNMSKKYLGSSFALSPAVLVDSLPSIVERPQIEEMGVHELVDLLRQLLSNDPSRRLSASRVTCHPFFWTAEERTDFIGSFAEFVSVEEQVSPQLYEWLMEPSQWLSQVRDWVSGLCEENAVGTRYKYDGTLMHLLEFYSTVRLHVAKHKTKSIANGEPSLFTLEFVQRFPDLITSISRRVETNRKDKNSLYYFLKAKGAEKEVIEYFAVKGKGDKMFS